MLDYQKAPYIELENYKAPEGINCIFVPMRDNKKIRLAFWKNNKEKSSPKGTILLQQGHNEFIEKYYETIQDLLDKSFDVICFDWRGQGMSDKMTNDIHKQYIEDFSVHNEDLNFIFRKIIEDNFSKPFIGFGHSMGGCLLTSYFISRNNILDKCILCAPMVSVRANSLSRKTVGLLGALEIFGLGDFPYSPLE